MSAAEQQNPRKPIPAESPDATPPPAGEAPDLSFARLLEQLEAEADKPGMDGSVSQIFATPPTQPKEPAPARPQDTQAFAPSAFMPAQPSPAQPAPVRSFAPQPAQLATTESAARDSAAFAPNPANPATVRAKAPAPSPTPQELSASAPAPPAAPPASGFAPGPPAAYSQPAPVLQSSAAAQPETAGEFTRIFTQLPTPRSAPPAILAEVAAAPPVPPPAPAPQPGEFTQFFRALDSATPPAAASPSPAGGAALLPIPPAPTLAPLAAQPAPPEAQKPAQPSQQTAQHIEPATQAFQPAPPAPPAIQAFQPEPQIPPAPAFAPPAPSPAAQPKAGAFTAFFNSPAPSSAGREIAANPIPAAPVRNPVPEPTFPTGFAEPPRSQPAAAGGFTELLRTLSNEGTPAPPNPPAWHVSTSQPTFSPAPAKLAPEQFSPQFSPLAPPPPQDSRHRDSAFAPQSSPQQPSAGEFTQLMQSLQQSTTKPAPPAVPAQAPFFDNTGPAFSQGESEYTRIIRTSASRSSEAPVPTFAPAPQTGGSASVGLPIAAPQLPKPSPPALPAAPPVKTKLQAMMPLLLAANGALLLLLIVLAVLFLRHHH
jgi:hypothetical protein